MSVLRGLAGLLLVGCVIGLGFPAAAAPGETRAALNAAPSLSDNLVSWWAAEKSTADAQGGNHGALADGAGFGQGLIGQAFTFDGVNDRAVVGHNESLSFGPGESMSVSLWAFRTSGATVQHILGKRTLCAAEDFNYQLHFNPGQGLVFGARDSFVETNVDLAMNTWVHLAATYDGSTYRFYIDGQLAAEEAGTLGAEDGSSFTIGSSGTCHSSGQAFGGKLDEVMLFSRALTASEARYLYLLGEPHDNLPLPLDAIAYFRAEDDPAGVTAQDSDGDNTATLLNGAKYGDGVLGNAYVFADESDVVDVSNEPNFDFDRTDSFSIEGWVKSTPKNVGNQNIFSKYALADGYDGYALALADTGNDALAMEININFQYLYVLGTTDVIDGRWHHVAVTYDGAFNGTAAGVKLYVDGKAEQTTVPVNFLPAGSILNDVSARIGGRHPSPNADNVQFNGSIDELAVYDRVLSAAEVRARYLAVRGPLPGDATCDGELDALDVLELLRILTGLADAPALSEPCIADADLDDDLDLSDALVAQRRVAGLP